MQLAILDTNVLVSGLFYPERPIGKLLDAIPRGDLVPIYDARVWVEYEDVLRRPRFADRYSAQACNRLLDGIRAFGVYGGADVVPYSGPLPDESDRPFAELAQVFGAPLVTGNPKHFPQELDIEVVSPAEMVRRLGL